MAVYKLLFVAIFVALSIVVGKDALAHAQKINASATESKEKKSDPYTGDIVAVRVEVGGLISYLLRS